MRGEVAWWGLLSAAAAPVVLVGGWTVAAALQPGSFSSVTQTISALAARDAADRQVMTVALLVVGLCHVVTALALRPVPRSGRWALAMGGVATALVALAPLPAADTAHRGAATTHAVAAAVSLGALAAWPAASWRRGPSPSWVLRPRVAVPAAVVLVSLVAWFAVELVVGGAWLGLAERVAATGQSLWPLVVVVALLRRRATSQPVPWSKMRHRSTSWFRTSR